MKFKDCYTVPGVVIDVDDPKYIGRVKADSPGLFDSSVMNKEGLPWIYPLSMSGYQRFSKLRNGSKIWILTDEEHHEFWYWPMFELNQDTRNIISENSEDYSESEVLLSRPNGDNSVNIYYSPSKGIMIQNSNETIINLKPDNEIEIIGGKGNVNIKNNVVYVGNKDVDYERAVLGEKLKDVFKDMKGYIEALNLALGTNYITAAVKMALQSNPSYLKFKGDLDNIDKILSDNVKLN